MGAIRSPRPVQPICGLISSDPDLMRRAVALLARHCGEPDAQSELWPFDSTDYYEPEMGPGLQRMFVAFGRLMDPGGLRDLKILTNDLERRISRDLGLPEQRRTVNLDPGYMALSKLVLATTKDHAHRVYLGGGIYAECTLRYEHARWVPWPWTYPDYADERYHRFFTEVRERYQARLQDLTSARGNPA